MSAFEIKSTVHRRPDRWCVQTGEMLTVFRDCEAAAGQIAILQGEILRLRAGKRWWEDEEARAKRLGRLLCLAERRSGRRRKKLARLHRHLSPPFRVPN